MRYYVLRYNDSQQPETIVHNELCGGDGVMDGEAPCLAATRHASLEGVGGPKTNEAYHSKADALLILEM